KDDPLSRGYICPKATGLAALSEDPDRLMHPVMKVDGSFVEITWEEAFTTIGERFGAIREKHGADAIATYLGNPNAHDFASNLSMPTLLRALGTKWRFSATSVDQLPKMFANQLLFGSAGSFAIPDIDHTDFFLVLGGNPLVSNGSIMTAPDMRGRLRRLRERGGQLVVVDPRRSETAAVADQHIPIRPGSDPLLLLAMVHVLFAEELTAPGRLAEFTDGIEELRELAAPFSPQAVEAHTGIAAETTCGLARRFAGAEKAACYGRIGICTQEFGTLASWLVDALNLLTGNLDRPGGVLFPRPAHAPAGPSRRKKKMPYARWRSRVRGLPEFGGELPVAALAEEIDHRGEQRVRALLTVAGNPVCSTPNAARLDRALGSLEFMVSIDPYINETTRHADIILPTTAPLERVNYPMLFHGLSVRNFAKWAPAVLTPPPGVKGIFEIACEIAGRVNGSDGATVEKLLRAGILARIAGPGSAHPDLPTEEADALLAPRKGPEYLLDAMIRNGDWGDGFRGEGLSLNRIAAAKHGLDLGPLTSHLPERLATGDGRIPLAHELIVADIARLRATLTRERPALVLIGRRHLRSNNSWMHNLKVLAKGPERCTLLVHPEDARRHGVPAGAQARIRSRVGEVIVPVELSDEMMEGVVSLPHGYGHVAAGTRMRTANQLQPGVNSNILTDEDGIDALSGNAILNSIPVTIEAVS
ncbi:MAG: molybdopterin-dependent oxidoreductase, partial [Deltaproteobacteria bacterium]